MLKRMFSLRFWLSVMPLLLPLSGSMATETPVELIGYLNYSATWMDDLTPRFGFYRFSSDGSTGLTAISNTVGTDEGVSHSGVYANGKYYGILVNGTYARYDTYFRVYDTETWTLENSIHLGTNNDGSITGDLTYDHTSNTIYASTRPFGNTETGDLVTIDPVTGAFTKIASTGFISALAADAKGQLWGIGRDGVLYRIGKDGSKEKVGSTGYIPSTEYSQSATIDYRTGRMFYIFNGYVEGDVYHTIMTRLFEIDLSTGAATTLVNFGNDERISALGIINANPDAPDNIADLSFRPVEPRSLTGRVSFTVPTVTYGQTTLNGNVDITLTLDGEPVGSATAVAGSTFTRDMIVSSEGNHTLTVVLSSGGHEGVKAVQTTFFGTDTPKPVTDLKFETDESRAIATLTWTTPTTGVNGGYIDTDNITYDIKRLPEQSDAATGYKGDGFTETIPDEMQYMRYKVEVCVDGQKSKAAYSNYAIAGQPHTIPFVEMFATEADFNKFTVIDANNDAAEYTDIFYAPKWHYDDEYAAAFYYTNNNVADDWLITPALKLEQGKVYRIMFSAYGYYGYDNRLLLTVGPRPTVEGQTHIIADRTFNAVNLEPVQIVVDFVAAEGDSYIGFHNVADKSDHMSIDNILVREMNSGDVPAAIANPDIKVNDEGKVEITFTTPTATANGKTLEGTVDVCIYKGIDTTPMATLKDCKPGEVKQWTDVKTIPAPNVYSLVVVNDNGESIQTDISIDLSEGIPGAVSDINALPDANGNILLTWAAPAGGVDSEGRTIVPGNVHYTITRISGATFTELVHDYSGLSFTDTDPLADVEGPQGSVFYRITPASATGEGKASMSPVVTVGEAYTIPFAETWMNQIATTGPWRSDSKNISWSVVSTGYDPYTLGKDGPGLLKVEGDSYGKQPGSGYYISPRINFSETTAPKLSFYMYGATTYADDTYLQVGYETTDGTRTLLPEMYYAKAEENGWREFTADLSAIEGQSSVSFLFYGNINTVENNCMHIDNVRVTGEAPVDEIKMESLSGPVTLLPGTEGEYKAVVANVGTNVQKEAKVSLSANGSIIDEQRIENLSTGESKEVIFRFTPSESMAQTTVNLQATVQSETDGIEANNERTISVSVGEMFMPYVSTISGYCDSDLSAVICWNTPDRSSVKKQISDGAEDYRTFAIDSIGHWTMTDGDLTYPHLFYYQEEDVEWENCDKLQSFMVFNPSKTTPSIPLNAHSGEQYFVCWSANGKANDDWMISPELTGDLQMISFYARAVSANYQEPFNVLFSYSGTDRSEFVKLNQQGTLAPKDTVWTLFRFTLPEGARHFAINYVGRNMMGLLIDDVQYNGFDTGRNPDGYNIYRDGIRLNTEPLTSLKYTDAGHKTGDVHSYYITAVYGDRESEPSDEIKIEIKEPTGIDTPTSGKSVARISTRPGRIVVEGAEGNEISVYTIDGRLVSRQKGSDISVITVHAGLYIVKTDGTIGKVVVR